MSWPSLDVINLKKKFELYTIMPQFQSYSNSPAADESACSDDMESETENQNQTKKLQSHR